MAVVQKGDYGCCAEGRQWLLCRRAAMTVVQKGDYGCCVEGWCPSIGCCALGRGCPNLPAYIPEGHAGAGTS